MLWCQDEACVFCIGKGFEQGCRVSLPACRRAPARTLGFRQARLRLRPPVLISAYSLALLAGLVDGGIHHGHRCRCLFRAELMAEQSSSADLAGIVG